MKPGGKYKKSRNALTHTLGLMMSMSYHNWSGTSRVRCRCGMCCANDACPCGWGLRSKTFSLHALRASLRATSCQCTSGFCHHASSENPPLVSWQYRHWIWKGRQRFLSDQTGYAKPCGKNKQIKVKLKKLWQTKTIMKNVKGVIKTYLTPLLLSNPKFPRPIRRSCSGSCLLKVYLLLPCPLESRQTLSTSSNVTWASGATLKHPPTPLGKSTFGEGKKTSLMSHGPLKL